MTLLRSLRAASPSPRSPCRRPRRAASAFAQSAGVLRVSAIPDEAPTELQRKFKPLGDYLKQETGIDVQFVPVTDYAAVVEGLATSKLDLAWLGGFTYVQATPAHQRRRRADRPARRGRGVHEPLHRADGEHGEDARRPQGQDLRLRLAVVDLGQPDAAPLPAPGRHRPRARLQVGRVLGRARRDRRLRRRRPRRGRRPQRVGARQADRDQERERREGARARGHAALLTTTTGRSAPASTRR